MGVAAIPMARARTDARDFLVEADEPLAGLQTRVGGDLPGLIVTPALLELVRRSRSYGLKLARLIRAQDDVERITAWVEVEPAEDGEGCLLRIYNWKTSPLPEEDSAESIARRWDIARSLAALSLRLGPEQQVLMAEAHTIELEALADRMRESIGRYWGDFVDTGSAQPMHWRLVDGARLPLGDSGRQWRAHMIPRGNAQPGSAGFELHFVAELALANVPEPVSTSVGEGFKATIGRELAPVLRQPVARIIANAETIRTQLAGPLADEYSNYAADIASAGEHLLALLDDLADLEVVEDEEFTTAPDHIDLADVARRAAGILGMRARERGIVIDAPKPGESEPAIGEFRRVLQILLNLLGNAIRYSPERSQIWLRVEREDGRARLIVADQGEGLSPEQQQMVFEKFERLGRKGDGGSGLGLYISRRLALAMQGELSVESARGQGARFVLDLPADPDAG